MNINSNYSRTSTLKKCLLRLGLCKSEWDKVED